MGFRASLLDAPLLARLRRGLGAANPPLLVLEAAALCYLALWACFFPPICIPGPLSGANSVEIYVTPPSPNGPGGGTIDANLDVCVSELTLDINGETTTGTGVRQLTLSASSLFEGEATDAVIQLSDGQSVVVMNVPDLLGERGYVLPEQEITYPGGVELIWEDRDGPPAFVSAWVEQGDRIEDVSPPEGADLERPILTLPPALSLGAVTLTVDGAIPKEVSRCEGIASCFVGDRTFVQVETLTLVP